MNRRELLARLPAWCVAGAAAGHGVARATPLQTLSFGQSASLTGGQAAYGKDVRDGIAAAFAAANHAEAVKGVRFELVTLDDGGHRERSKANVKKLIDDGAVGLIGLTSGAAAESILPMVEASQITLLGTASGNMGIRQDAKAPVCNVRAGYDVEYRRMVRYIKDFGMRRVGYVYLQDTSSANLDAMTQALKLVGVTPAVTLPIDRNSKSLLPAAQALLNARLDCVLFTTNAEPVLTIVEAMGEQAYGGMYFSSSFAGQELVDKLPATNRSVVMSIVVPRPSAIGVGVVSHAQRDLAAHGNGAKLGITTLEGYIAGRVAVEAARQAQRAGAIQRASLREAFNGLEADLGGYRVAYGRDRRDGSQYVDVVVVDRYGRMVG